MVGDNILLKEKYQVTASAIYNQLVNGAQYTSQDRQVIVIAGESGSGKSVTANCLKKVLEDKGSKAFILYQDDYFFRPPLSNHLHRISNINSVGLDEVNLNLLQVQLDEFLNGSKQVQKPLVYYNENIIGEEIANLENVQFLIIEGTYCLSLKRFTFGIFMDRNYLETKQNRIERARDEQSDFVEKVLEIEHKIIRPLKKKAQCIVEKDYSVVQNTNYESE